MTKIAFIGFGEAGGLLADGLLAAGADVRAAYDILIHHADEAPAHRDKCTAKGVIAAESSEDAIAGAELVFSAVTSKEILAAAENAAPHLQAGQAYLDINSASPAAKKKAAVLIEANGAHFVEAAIMDLVPPHGHKVPMLFAGEKAPQAADQLSSFGMNVRVIGKDIGKASSVKMVRSVFMKGFSAVFLESLFAASKLNAEDAVIDSLQMTFPELNWKEMGDYYTARLIQHAKRQSEEMHSVAETLQELGVEPITAMASAKRLGWLADLKLDELSADLPEGYNALLKLMGEAEQ